MRNTIYLRITPVHLEVAVLVISQDYLETGQLWETYFVTYTAGRHVRDDFKYVTYQAVMAIIAKNVYFEEKKSFSIVKVTLHKVFWTSKDCFNETQI